VAVTLVVILMILAALVDGLDDGPFGFA